MAEKKAIVLILAKNPDAVLAVARRLGFNTNVKITMRSLHKGHNTLYVAIPAECRNALRLKHKETVYVGYAVVEQA